MNEWVPGLEAFMEKYQRMRLSPSPADFVILKGSFEFKAQYEDYPEIQDSYRLSIAVGSKFPRELPTIKEIGGRIRPTKENHVNEDGTLCLGSPLRLYLKLAEQPDLVGYGERCLIPYLYGHSYRRIFGVRLPFGELAHGVDGELADYLGLFGVETYQQVLDTIRLLCLRAKKADGMLCPCGCGKRLSLCNYRDKIDGLRKLGPPSWFKQNYKHICRC